MKEKLDNMQHEMRESATKIWLAGLGAVSMAGEEGQKLFKSLVEKGQEFEGREGAPVDSVKKGAEQAKGRMEDIWNRFEDSFNDKIAMVLQKMGVPTRDEINQLTDRVDKLMSAIEKLNENQADKKK
jgi:poly(hydroxyalkanoate) granule-associated protein